MLLGRKKRTIRDGILSREPTPEDPEDERAKASHSRNQLMESVAVIPQLSA